jgi:anti-sigma regulatory factor (Ser/Thr protein kinase)
MRRREARAPRAVHKPRHDTMPASNMNSEGDTARHRPGLRPEGVPARGRKAGGSPNSTRPTGSGAPPASRIELSYPAVETAVPAARRSIACFAADAGLSDDRLDDARLAVSEAVTNVVKHAYRDGTGEVWISAIATPETLWISIADNGCGHQTPALNAGLGFGLKLMLDACDEFRVTERAEGGTEVSLGFRIAAAELAS